MIAPLISLALALPAARAADTIAILRSDDLPAYDAPVEAFARAIGRPVRVYDLHGDKAAALRVAAELKADPPPAVLALGTKAAWTAARELPTTIPVVYAMVREPERYGVDGINITGVRMEVPPELVLAQLRLFAPEVNRLGILLSAQNSDPFVGQAIQAAKAAGYTVTARRVTSARDVQRQSTAMLQEVDAIWLLPDPLVITPANFHSLRGQAARARVPLLSYTESLVEAGALLCVAPDRDELGLRAAARMKLVLDEGATPGSLPPVVPEATRVVLNRDAADAAGLVIDPALMDFVDEVLRQATQR